MFLCLVYTRTFKVWLVGVHRMTRSVGGSIYTPSCLGGRRYKVNFFVARCATSFTISSSCPDQRINPSPSTDRSESKVSHSRHGDHPPLMKGLFSVKISD